MLSRQWMTARRVIALCGVSVAIIGAAWAAQTAMTLKMNGKIVSSKIRLINGQAYVPLADIAKANGLQLVKSGSNGYELIAAGGANQVEGMRGKVGDTLFDGKWRFKVNDVQRGLKAYTIRREGGVDFGATGGKVNIDPDLKTLRADDGYEFVIVNARITNGQKTTTAFGSAYGEHTALTDTMGSSYRPIGWDQAGGQITTKALLPGAGQDIAAIFLIPEGTQLKDLVFTLTNVSDRNPHDVRVTLTP